MLVFKLKQQKKTKPYLSRGFTLIELLVGISIIALLSSIVIVETHNARIAARDVLRISNMKQLVSGLDLFYQDNGQYPPGETEFPFTVPGGPIFPILDTSANGVFIPELASSGYMSGPVLDSGNSATGRGILNYYNFYEMEQYFSDPNVFAYTLGNAYAYACGGQFSLPPYSPMPKYMLITYLEKTAAPKDIKCKGGSADPSSVCMCAW